MKIFFDTEFTGLHKNTTLISIGLIDENGRTFYAEFSDYDEAQCDDWINENVIKHLKFANAPYPAPITNLISANEWEVYGDKPYVKEVLYDWLSKYESIELVSDVSHYDMVLFIDIWGGAFDIPSSVNPACHDINQDIARYYEISETEAFDYSREQILQNNHTFANNYFIIPKCFNVSLIASSFSLVHFGCLESLDFALL